MPRKRILISSASRKLGKNILTALPKESEGVPSVLPENPNLLRVSIDTCRHDEYCHLIKIKGGGKCYRDPNQCHPFKFYQRYARGSQWQPNYL